MGRPTDNPKYYILHVRINEEMCVNLRNAAKTREISVSEYARRIVERHWRDYPEELKGKKKNDENGNS